MPFVRVVADLGHRRRMIRRLRVRLDAELAPDMLDATTAPTANVAARADRHHRLELGHPVLTVGTAGKG